MENKYLMPKNFSLFLEGPGKRLSNLIFCWKVAANFFRGLRALHFCGPSITVFGSARYNTNSHYYKSAEFIGTIIAEMGFTTITGGGPGLMEAANKGAYKAGGYSVGCNIILPQEQGSNPYLHTKVTIPYFFIRKTLLIKYSHAFIVLPGGIGALDELFEALTLTQTGKIMPFPIIVFGKEFYAPIRKQIEAMHNAGTLQMHELSNLFFTNSFEEIEYILQEYVVKYLHLQEAPKPYWYFLEKRKSL